MQPLLRSYAFYRDADRPDGAASRDHFESGVCLPSGSNLTEGQQDRVIAKIRSLFGGSGVRSAHA